MTKSRDDQTPRPRTAAQRASDKNREQQLAVRANGARPADRRSPSEGETGDAGLSNDLRPVGVKRRR